MVTKKKKTGVKTKHQPKKKLTRKAEQRVNKKTVEALANQEKFMTLMYQTLFHAHDKACELYFGKALPAELWRNITENITQAIQEQAGNGKDIDLMPVVQDNVAAWLEIEKEKAGVVDQADGAANE